jgi:hypothetical protein
VVDDAHNPMTPARRPVGNTLKNGVVGGDPTLASRCGARNRRGMPCGCPALRGRQRCQRHGGRSTGPRTAEGIERMRAAKTKHGGRSRDMQELLRRARRLLAAADAVAAASEDSMP